MTNCPLCNDTGKSMQANGQPGEYLGCSCTASTERADMHFAASKFVTEYPLGGDNLDDDLAWFIHQRAKALGRAEALAELHPLWLAEKERAERAEADKKRLDWFETQSMARGFEGHHESNEWCLDGPFATLRNAIDACMELDAKRAESAAETGG